MFFVCGCWRYLFMGIVDSDWYSCVVVLLDTNLTLLSKNDSQTQKSQSHIITPPHQITTHTTTTNYNIHLLKVSKACLGEVGMLQVVVEDWKGQNPVVNTLTNMSTPYKEVCVVEVTVMVSWMVMEVWMVVTVIVMIEIIIVVVVMVSLMTAIMRG